MIDKRIIDLVENVKPCEQCGDTNDFMIVFAKYPICARCIRKNHRKAVKK